MTAGPRLCHSSQALGNANEGRPLAMPSTMALGNANEGGMSMPGARKVEAMGIKTLKTTLSRAAGPDVCLDMYLGVCLDMCIDMCLDTVTCYVWR